jgi:rSAM/selenodomain-associated transferase 1
MIVMLMKAPQQGKVKTRLAKVLGEIKALEIYKLSVNRMFKTLNTLNLKWKIAYYPPNTKNFISEQFGSFEGFPQIEGDLGTKMAAIFEQEFKNTNKVILIGSDAPQIDKKLLEKAFLKLDTHDCVIGPAQDGGYYLIGFKNTGYTSLVFEDMNWSTSSVYGKTLKRLINKKVYRLQTLCDLDTVEDYEKLKEFL